MKPQTLETTIVNLDGTLTFLEKSTSNWAFDYINADAGWDKESIMINKSTLLKALNELLPDKVISFAYGPSFYINTETCTIIENQTELDITASKKCLSTMSRRILTDKDFGNIKSKYLYIYEIKKHADYLELRLAEYHQNKKAFTFTMDESVIEKFSELSNKLAINKSKFVENKIKEFIELNSK